METDYSLRATTNGWKYTSFSYPVAFFKLLTELHTISHSGGMSGVPGRQIYKQLQSRGPTL